MLSMLSKIFVFKFRIYIEKTIDHQILCILLNPDGKHSMNFTVPLYNLLCRLIYPYEGWHFCLNLDRDIPKQYESMNWENSVYNFIRLLVFNKVIAKENICIFLKQITHRSPSSLNAKSPISKSRKRYLGRRRPAAATDPTPPPPNIVLVDDDSSRSGSWCCCGCCSCRSNSTAAVSCWWWLMVIGPSVTNGLASNCSSRSSSSPTEEDLAYLHGTDWWARR